MVSQKFKMDLKEIISWLFRIILIILIIYVAYQVLKAILGGTWANENIIIAGMGIILAGMFVIVGFLINQGKVLGMLEERTKNIGNSLSNLGNDFKIHISKNKH
jgi:ABC-type transport system involved in multi-copper enzyme maturation permease subunit